MRALPLLIGLLLPSSALATWPDDVSLSSMTHHNGLPVTDQAALLESYERLVQELGAAIANKPYAPAATLGANGFGFSVGSTGMYTNPPSREGPTPWERAHADETPEAFLFVPTISARKGLPYSVEVGATLGWLGLTHQGVFSGFARVALLEGYKPLPDLTVQVGYAGYVGNPELEMGVVDLSVSLGSTFPFGTYKGIHHGQLSPYVNVGFLQVGAAPVVDAQTGEAIFGADAEATIGRRSGYGLRPQIAGGFNMSNSTVLFRAVATYAVGLPPTLHAGIGFTY